MSALQSAHQHRQDSWLFNFGEEEGVVTLKRQEGRKTKARRYTVYHCKCRGCSKEFKCPTKAQPYCSSQCYGAAASLRKSNPLAKTECIRCLSILGFGAKTISRKFYNINPTTMRCWIRKMGIGPSNSKIAATRMVHSSKPIKVDLETRRKEMEHQRTIKRIERKIKWVKDRALLIQKAAQNYGPDFPWRQMSYSAIKYWANIDAERKRCNEKAKARIIKKGSHAHIKKICGNMIWRAIRNGYVKKEKTMRYFGCSTQQLKNHLQFQFDRNMTWDNYGTYWEVDHIMPCNIFDLTREDHVAMCNNYTNLRPLEKTKNRSKHAKIINHSWQFSFA